jgi:hypothetical protein
MFGLRIINSDGTYAGFSGNGIRIFARYLLDAGYVRPDTSLVVQTWTDEDSEVRRSVQVKIAGGGDDCRIDVQVPHAPRFGPDAIKANREAISDCADTRSFSVKALVGIGETITGKRDAWRPRMVSHRGPLKSSVATGDDRNWTAPRPGIAGAIPAIPHDRFCSSDRRPSVGSLPASLGYILLLDRMRCS